MVIAENNVHNLSPLCFITEKTEVESSVMELIEADKVSIRTQKNLLQTAAPKVTHSLLDNLPHGENRMITVHH